MTIEATSDLAFSSWITSARQIRFGDLTSVELTGCLLDRIAQIDPTLNAFVRICADSALADAERADQERTRGHFRGPLHGVPFAIKDIIDAQNHPTTAHSRILLDNTATADATVTKRLKAAGGILLGKLATHEFAIGGPCFDLPFPPARNPWDPSRHPGGSSSGSGSAVAAGLVALALGSDTGGSIRNPAGACGIVGMKPTFGRVPRRGVVPLAYSLDTVGPLTRTVAENAAALSLLVKPDPLDPTKGAGDTCAFGEWANDDIRDLTIGVVGHFHERDMPAASDVGDALEDAFAVLGQLGAKLIPVELPPLDDFAHCNRVILVSEGYTIHERWLRTRPQDYASMTRERLLVGAFVRATDYINALRKRRQLAAALDRCFDQVDVLVCASSMDDTCAIDDVEAIKRTYTRHARTPFNVGGHPTLALPCGFSKTGLPIAMQIAGRAFDERTVYRVAAAYERTMPWKDRHPSLARNT